MLEQTSEETSKQMSEEMSEETSEEIICDDLINEKNSVLRSFTINSEDYINLIKRVIVEIDNKLLIKPEIVIYVSSQAQRREGKVGFFLRVAELAKRQSNISKGYKYSNKLMVSQSIEENLMVLLNFVNNLFEKNFNGILINRYNSGEEYISAHSDDESNLDNVGILTISYGQERTFRVRNKNDKSIKLDHLCKSGKILIMLNDFQKHFTHEIPIEKNKNGVRYSITFRKHLT
jgi:alkylated DNA repair dioxygenase AlkB